MAEETTMEKTEKEKKPKTPREGPILKFLGPDGASKIIALLGALSIILQGNTAFWTGGVNAVPVNGLNIFCGVMLWILGIILILMIGIIGFGTATLKKIEIVEKYYNPLVLILIALLVMLFELLSISSALLAASSLAIITTIETAILGGVLIIIAAVLERTKDSGKMKPSKFVGLVGAIFAIAEAIVLFGTLPIILSRYWDACVAMIVVILLLLSMYDKIKFVPYEWWMVLILGFILYGWVPGIGGTLVLISFVLMLIER